jgi:Mce-associated membrane protein
MTNATVSEDEKTDAAGGKTAADDGAPSATTATEPTAGSAETPGTAADTAGTADEDAPSKLRRGFRSPWLWVAVVLVAAVLGGAFGFFKYHQLDGQLTQLRQAQADRDAAAQLAKDYALKSLTYSFEDPDAFFHGVEDGVSQQLKDKYVNAADLLKSVMLQAQVSSTGEVLATDPVLQPDGSYQVVVSAHQTTRNMQNPTPKVSIILLQVTVNKVGNAWQVTDIGPKTGSRPAVEQQLPAPEPPAGPGPAPAPTPAPAPAKPAPPR